MCKISIIMPVYNKEKYIKKAIESILNQTFKDWEMLIIDDGSTDDSLAVCRIFEDPRIHVISTEIVEYHMQGISELIKHRVNILHLWMEMIIWQQIIWKIST